MSNDYIELGPNTVIQEGDEFYNLQYKWQAVTPSTVGDQVRQYAGLKFRRPRSTLIRDAAIELLRWYLYAGASGITSAKFEKLKAAVGLTDEELRGEA